MTTALPRSTVFVIATTTGNSDAFRRYAPQGADFYLGEDANGLDFNPRVELESWIKKARARRGFKERQVLGAISEFDKAMTVAKLRGARDRKRREAGKCEGRKSHAELNPGLVALVRQLRRRRPKGGTRSLRKMPKEVSLPDFVQQRP
jgi:hypothetical protein